MWCMCAVCCCCCSTRGESTLLLYVRHTCKHNKQTATTGISYLVLSVKEYEYVHTASAQQRASFYLLLGTRYQVFRMYVVCGRTLAACCIVMPLYLAPKSKILWYIYHCRQRYFVPGTNIRLRTGPGIPHQAPELYASNSSFHSTTYLHTNNNTHY